jgi:hypothetical protein
MTSIKIPQRIHIAPVGFEKDRVVLPLQQMSADRIYLIIEKNQNEDKGLIYLENVQKYIKKLKLKCEVNLVHSNVIERDLFSALYVYRGIIEKEQGNQIYVNVSTGTKIHSIAGMMACMIFNSNDTKIIPYYVIPEDYNEPESHEPFARGCKNILPLPSYKIEKPEEKLVRALKIIDEIDKSGEKISKFLLIEKFSEINLITVSDERTINAKYRSLERNFIEPLIDWKFIKIQGKGKRLEISITMEGKNILRFLG